MQIWSEVAQVRVAVTGAGRLDVYAGKRAGGAPPLLVAEAYGQDGLVAAGELVVWDLNQALAALMSQGGQARRLQLRDDGRHDGGYLDVVADQRVDLYVTSTDGARKAVFTASAAGLVRDLNTVLRHYLTMTRTATPRTIVLPDAAQDSARATLIRPAP